MSSPSSHATEPEHPRNRPDSPRQPAPELPTDPAKLQREIDSRQDHLARTVDELAARVAPKEIARRTAADVQVKAREAVLDEDGALRVERIAAVGAAVLGLLGAAAWRRRRS